MNIDFPAMRGKMGHHEYYVAMIKLADVVTIFETYLEKKIHQSQSRAEIDLLEEAQRRMNLRRIPEIKEYILSNPSNWVFSALTASFKDAEFVPFMAGYDIGTLHFKGFSKFTINDGQHRCAALKEALKEDPSLEEQTISIVFFKADNVNRMQQIFTDLNRSAAKVSGSVVVAMGSMPIERATVEVTTNNPFLRTYTEMERTSPLLGSDKLFALSAIYQANINFVGKHIKEGDVNRAVKKLATFWSDLYSVMPLWKSVANREITPAEVKRDYICNHAMILRSLATLLRIADQKGPEVYQRVLKQIETLNWKKRERYWQGKAVNENGSVINSKTAESYIVANLRSKFGLATELS